MNLKKSFTNHIQIILITCLYLLFSPLQIIAAQTDLNTIGINELKNGMKGTGYSVIKGTEPEPFSVELINIVEGPVAGKRYLLIKIPDESLHIGSGFSGSPVYFEGKLAGAFSHMETNLTSQIGLVVPIANMLEDAALSTFIKGKTLPIITDDLKPGSMISLVVVRGDFWIGSSGTVTYLKKDLLLAFGHENRFNGDSVQLPIHKTFVNTIVPRIDSSHKDVTLLEEIGSTVYDGKSAVVGRLGVKAPMSPFTVEYHEPSGFIKKYKLEILNNTKLAPNIIANTIRFVVSSVIPNNPVGVDLDATITLGIKDLEAPLTISQRLDADILKSNNPLQTNILQTIMNTMLFPVHDVNGLTSLSISLTPIYAPKSGRIAEAFFTRRQARPGEKISLRVNLIGQNGEIKELTVPITIPVDYDKPTFNVSVNAGKTVRPSENRPSNIQEIATWLSGIARNDELVVLTPGMANNSLYSEAQLNKTVARTEWNVDGNTEASIAIIGLE